MGNYLLKIRKSTPQFPVLERIAKLPFCEYADSVSGEIDGIAKISASEEELQKLIDEFDINVRDVEKIKREYQFKVKKGNLPFWINLRVKSSHLPQAENFIRKHSRIIRNAYITTRSSIYIRGEASSVEELDEFWKSLYEELGNGINQRSSARTYIAFSRFKGLRRLSHVVNFF